MGRVGTVDDVAAMILHLADSVKSGWVTGQTFVLDGGRLLALHGLRS
jgi:NAD(P)-dependent dehydrogenase (short-subunit alcohol dehydrogenase family)